MPRNAEIQVEWTQRFKKNYERYNGQRASIRLRIFQIIRKMHEEPTTWLRNFEKLNDSVGNIYRDKISQGDRLIFSPSGGLLLVDVGPHEIMEEFQDLGNRAKRETLLDKSIVPQWFLSDLKLSDFRDLPWHNSLNDSIYDNSEMRWLYEEELNESWIQFLDVQQAELKDRVFNRLKYPGEFEFHLILGGAGTGKTIVLLNLALSLASAGRNVVCQFNDQVLRYLNSGAQKVPGSGLSMQPGSVVLLDDPHSYSDFKQKIAEARKVGARALVVALDPFQWTERRVYEKFNDLIQISKPIQHKLNVCYRQSHAVGQQALDLTNTVLEKTSPFFIDSKIDNHKKHLNPLKEICVDDVSFVDSGGRYRIYESNLTENFNMEFDRFLAREDKWTHWHPMLILFDPVGTTMPTDWVERIRGHNILYKSTNQINKIRGSEFQEIVLLISERTWTKLHEGVQGAGAMDWEKLIGLHTILTRSKDTTLIFVSK